MADQNEVQIRFTASTGDVTNGIEEVHGALGGLKQDVANVAGALAGLQSAFSVALPVDKLDEARKAFDGLGDQTARTTGQIKDMGTEIKLMHLQLAQRKIVLQAEAQQFAITQNQKFALLENETEKEYQAELALLESKLKIGDDEVEENRKWLGKIAVLKAKHNTDMIRLDAQAIAEQAKEWNQGLSMITSSFNSQLRGLLAGTTTWSQAWKKMLGDMAIKFIEFGEQMLQKWIAMELAKTTASTSGALARQAVEQSASSAGILSALANALKSIFASAGQTGAAVSAAVAPTTGPAAPAIGAAAAATVVAENAPLVSMDVGGYVLRSGIAMVHQGEVIPAAKVSTPYRGDGMAGNSTLFAPSINITAMDSRSIRRFFDDNAHHMIRALYRGLKGGAHLPLRTQTR
jgi:hypothetical protein